MATLHHPAYEYRDSASRQADTPLFHAVEQKLHAGWLFDPGSQPLGRLPLGRPAPPPRQTGASGADLTAGRGPWLRPPAPAAVRA